jgi:hypothetical protein
LNSDRMHGYTLSCESKERTSGQMTWSRERKEGSGMDPRIEPPQSYRKLGSSKQGRGNNPTIALAAPTRVSPAPATEQKQDQKNNQYGFHCCTSLVRGSWTGLWNGRLTSSDFIIEGAKRDV